MRYAVILAGGSGTRLWPLSRATLPKQLLPLGPQGETLLELACRRAHAVIPGTPLVVTHERFLEASLRAVPDAAFIGEPEARNTAVAVGLAATMLYARDPQAVMVVLPADHHIGDEAELQRALTLAVGRAEQAPELGLIGLTPTAPATGYGYIHAPGCQPHQATRVVMFEEKPALPRAQAMVASGEYLWNGGIFVARAALILEALRTHAPEVAQALAAYAQAAGPDAQPLTPAWRPPSWHESELRTQYAELPRLAFDHVVQQLDARFVVACQPGWEDLGSWPSLAAVLPSTGGNHIHGEVLASEASGNLVWTDQGLVALHGVHDLIIVRSGDAVLVVPKAHAQAVRELVATLAQDPNARFG